MSNTMSEQAAEVASKIERPGEGWGNPEPFNSRSKFHYFRGGMSLCRKWGFYRGDLEQGNDEHWENCGKCQKSRLAEKEVK
jgi:hypothetical protein